MKQIKDLKIKTQEGFSVKNLQRFPSMEYGSEGGISADLYLNGIYIGNLFNAGDGGPATFNWSGSTDKYSPIEVKEKVYSFLIRNDEDFGPNSKYEFMRNKTVKNIDDDDIEVMITLIEEHYEVKKQLTKYFKKGYNTVAVIDQDYQFRYIYSPRVINLNAVAKYAKEHSITYSDIKIYHSLQDVALAL